MAAFNEILAGRFNRALQKLLNMKGFAPASVLAPEVMPVLQFFRGVETLQLEGWDRWMVGQSQSAVGAQTNAHRLRNPVGSNVVISIEHVSFDTNLADPSGTFGIKAIATDLTTPVLSGAYARIDARTQRLNPTGIVSSAAGSPSAFPGIFVPTGATTLLALIQNEDQEFTLLPGDAAQYTTSVVNNNSLANWIWRERALEDSEVKS
jgi:hypothetical protein